MSDEHDLEYILQGAQFLHPHVEVRQEKFDRKPEEYMPTNKFRRRMKELKGIVTGSDIRDAIRYGELIQASQGCYAYVTVKAGYTISFIFDPHDNMRNEMKSIWPYIYNKDEVWAEGGLSSKQVHRIETYIGEHQDNW